MSEVEDFVAQMLPRYLTADAMHNGDPAPFVDLCQEEIR